MAQAKLGFLTAYEFFVNEIFLYFFTKTQQRDTAKSLTQETFIKTWHDITEAESTFARRYELRHIHKLLRRNAEQLITRRNMNFAT